MPESCSLIGYQQHLFALPQRQPLAVAEWRVMQRQGMERRHQKFSRSSRKEAEDFYRRVFLDGARNSPGADDTGNEHQKRADPTNDSRQSHPAR